MVYPTSPPKVKHNLVSSKVPASSSSASLSEECGFQTTAQLFHALEDETPLEPATLRVISPVYSYNDAPTIPLSRDLVIAGVADVSLSVVRKLIGGDSDHDQLPSCLHKCTIAVKRADKTHARALRPEDITHSRNFAKFLRRLLKEDLVAILALDKYRRMGILQPSPASHQQQEYTASDFACACYVGEVNAIKQQLTQTMAPQEVRPTTPPIPPPDHYQNDSPIWKPPGDDHDNNNDDDTPSWKPPGGDHDNTPLWKPPNQGDDTDPPLWKPPGDDDGADQAPLWKPPGDDDNDNNDDAPLWKPPGENDDNGQESAGFWMPPHDNSTHANESSFVSTDENHKKRKRDEEEEETFHANKGAADADRFYSDLKRSLDTRADSRIFHMRAFNGWVKATQIQELDPKVKGQKALRILDLACGKGGDLGKWVLHPRGIENYVGIDVARGSLVDAAERARQMKQKLKRCTFSCADLGADVPGRMRSSKHKQMQKLLTWSLQEEGDYEFEKPKFQMRRGGGISEQDKFDVVSIQFAIHYMMSTKKRARRFFQTVSQLLEIGGNLIATTIDARVVVQHMMNLGINLHEDADPSEQKAIVAVGGGACRITFEPKIVRTMFQASPFQSTSTTMEAKDLDENLFGLEYVFTLVEGSDHEAGVGDAVNLPEWLTPIPVLKSLAAEAGLELEYAQNFHEFYKTRSDPSTHAAAHSSLYNMKVLNRNGSISEEEWDISRLYAAVKFRKVRESSMDVDEWEEEEPDDENEELPEIDQKLKAKLLPMAMLKAKKAVGNESWASLSSDDKTKLTEVELRKLAASS